MPEPWLTGSAVRKMLEYVGLLEFPMGHTFVHRVIGRHISRNMRAMRNDHERLVGLVKELQANRSDDGGCRYCGSRVKRCLSHCPYRAARACLKAQGA